MKKAAREGRPVVSFGFRRGFLDLYGSFFAFDMRLAAFLFQVFIVLFSHNILYIRRWLRFGVAHYEFLQATFQSLFLTGSPVAAGLRLFHAPFSSQKGTDRIFAGSC